MIILAVAAAEILSDFFSPSFRKVEIISSPVESLVLLLVRVSVREFLHDGDTLENIEVVMMGSYAFL